MPKIFKGTEKRPFNYQTIHEHKRTINHMIWVIGTLIIIGAGTLLFWQNRSSDQFQNTPPSTAFVSSTPTSTAPVSVDYKAAFAIYTNGTVRIFTASMYHNLSEDVYIKADNPNIIHVKKVGVTWDDFFKTLPFKLTAQCLTTGTKQTFCDNGKETLKFYLNGVKTDDLLSKEIREGDKALITYSNESDTEIQKQLDQLTDITL